MELGKQWLDLDLSSYSLYLMPIGFLPPSGATGIAVSNDERNVINYLAKLMTDDDDNRVSDFHISLDVNISFKRTSAADATAVIISNDPNALAVTISEEDIRRQYPWQYSVLVQKLRARYSNFKENDKYHTLRKNLAADPRYMKSRYLDQGNPKSPKRLLQSQHHCRI